MKPTPSGPQRALVYARVSTDEQSQNYSLPMQLATGTRYAQQQGMIVIKEIQDAASGATLDRPGLAQARAMIQRGEVDALIVVALDRLTRALGDRITLQAELKRAGVELHAINRGGRIDDSPSGVLSGNIDAVVAEYERERILERTAMGRRGKVESGTLPGNGPPPYGYRAVGQGRERRLEIDDAEAELVRLIFTWYVQGDGGPPLTATQVAAKLTGLAIPTRADRTGHPSKKRPPGHWNPEFIRDLLHDAVYQGEFYAYRYQKTPDKRDVRRPRDEWLPVSVPAIVPNELWAAAQERLGRGKALAPRNSTNDRYLLRCRIRCSCGYAWIGKYIAARDITHYVCIGRWKQASRVHSCAMPYIPAERLEAAVWQWIRGQVLDEDALLVGLRQKQAEADQGQAQMQQQVAALEQQQAQNEILVARLTDLYLTNGIDRVAYDRRRADLLAVRERIQAEIQSLTAQTYVLSDREIATLQQFAHLIRTELDTFDRGDQRQVLDLLDVRITMGLEEGQPVAQVRCRLSTEAVAVSIDTSAPWN